MKKTIQTIALAALCLFLSIVVEGQTVALKTGDRLPDMIINNLQNDSLRLSDFRGKLLILDFWSLNCLASIDLLDDMASLQQKFSSQIKIIAIGKGEENKLKEIISSKNLPGLSFAFNDTHLYKLFPHYLVPQLVWIDPQGSVIGITTSADANEPTITKLLNGEAVVFKDPKADRMDYSSEKPLFSMEGFDPSSDLYHSVLSSYTTGLPSGYGIKKDSTRIRIHAINQNRLQLYFLALKLPQYSWPSNRILFGDVNPEPFRMNDWLAERQDKAYCYELLLPLLFEDRANAIMLQDLRRLFGAGARIEKRDTRCYVLTRIPGEEKLETTGARSESNLYRSDMKKKFIVNYPITALIEYMENLPDILPVLDETGFTGRVDLQLNDDLSDIPALNMELGKYGLKLEEAQREIDMLVFYSTDM